MRRLEDIDDVDREIIRLVVDGESNKTIARMVGLPEGTVKWRFTGFTRGWGRLPGAVVTEVRSRQEGNE